MTDSTVDSDAFAGILAGHPIAAEPDDKQRNLRRTLAGAAVAAVHLFALLLILFSLNQVPVIRHVRETIPEAIMWIPMPRPAHPPRHQQEQPPDTFPFVSAPITLPPEPRRDLHPPPASGLEGVGRSLACGASSFEYLSPMQRENCLRHPWAYIKRPDGTIVLEVPKPVEPPPSAIDILRHEQATAPPCPLLANVPCLGKALHGDPLSDPLGRPNNF